ncbi:MAG: four-helix bundle copper-binding protein [Nannocystaceae bacterium]|nr:four-helix bundle copper-binding protein [bacterium]
MRFHRRELLIAGAGALAAKATATTIACAADPEKPAGKKAETKTDAKGDTKMEELEGHEGHEGHGKAPAADVEVDPELVNIVADCVAAGRVCLNHCLRMLGTGDTSMAECSRAVSDMLAICEASESLAAAGSKHLKALAKVCVTACTDCAKACEPHVGHHAECKACKEACDATIAAMKAV